MGAYSIPARAFYQQALLQRDSFLSMPQMFCGYYLFGEEQVGMLHPLHLLLYRFLSLETAVNAESLLSYVWMFVGTYLMLRRFNFRGYASLVGAMSFAFCGSNLLHYSHMSGIDVIAHIPWLIYGTAAVIET